MTDTSTHTCARCRTPYGVSEIPCPADVATQQITAHALADAEIMRQHLAEQNMFWATHDRADNTPDWADLNAEEQLTLDENRYLLENGGIAFGNEDDEMEND